MGELHFKQRGSDTKDGHLRKTAMKMSSHSLEVCNINRKRSKDLAILKQNYSYVIAECVRECVFVCERVCVCVRVCAWPYEVEEEAIRSNGGCTPFPP